MISMLDRKLLRDLLEIGTQAVAISLVMSAGVAMFIMALGALDSLSNSKEKYYRDYRFADVFASAKRVPSSLRERIEGIPGVSRICVRIVSQVSLDVPGLDEPAQGRFISLPEYERPALNDLFLVRGRMLDPERSGELLISKSFAEAHRIGPGDSLQAVINGRKQQFKIVGVALTPEYVIQIQPGNLVPDHQRFGVFWLSQREMEAAFDMNGAFNDVSLLLDKAANEQAVIASLDYLLEPYGCTGSYGRAQQTSHSYISDEIRQLSTMALVAPSIFLGVAAFLLNVVIARIVGLQREQIAALKAFGYSNWAVGWHYLKLVLLIATLGSLLGTVGGYLLSRTLTQMYAKFYEFPSFSVGLQPRIVAGAVAISFAAAAFGALNAVRRAVALPPAQAMRAEPPLKYRPTLVERLGVGRLLTQVTRMILRQIERKPVKSGTAILGIGMAVAILMLGSFSLDAIRYIMHFQFRIAQRQQLSVALLEKTSPHVVHALTQLPGGIRVETFRSLATKLRNGHRWRRVSVLGLDSGAELFRLLNVRERPVELPPEGLVLSDKLAELLAVKKGDVISMAVLEGERPVLDVVVSAVITEYGGLNAYMNRQALHRLLKEAEVVSGAFLGVEPALAPKLYRQLKETPRVAGVTVKNAVLKSFQNTIAENILMMRTFNILFAVIIAFGVVYNSARISLAEQSRELATLRVMGFSRFEVSAILLGELAILTLLAVPVGWVIGYGLVASFVQAMDTEIYRIPLVIERTTYLFAALVVILAALVSGLVVQRRIRKLDLIAVLKAQE
ncbi:MAG: ABC transporter permease [Planctomycetota bacterium]